MKNILLFSVLVIPIFLIYSFSPTETIENDFAKCKVLKKSINSEYDGECKKGLAHGKGTAKGAEDWYEGSFKKGLPSGKGKYIWGNGEFYQGDFKEGVRHGQGVMYSLNEETGAVEKGKLSLWKNDEFVMEIMEEKYTIIRKRNVVSVSAKKHSEDKNQVTIQLKNTTELQDVSITHDVGALNKFRDDRYVINFVEFPLNVMVTYTTANKLNANRLSALVELKIESPGEWTLDISN